MAQVIAEYENGTLVRKFIYGPGIDEPIMMITVNGGNETKYYYLFDGLGSVAALSDSSGNIVEEYSYKVYGEPNRISSVGNPYMFTGRRYDSETSLYYYRARYYKPEIGRFLQTDPIGYYNSLNLYQYCGNNPLNWIDPLGLCQDEASDIPYLTPDSSHMPKYYDNVDMSLPVPHRYLIAKRKEYHQEIIASRLRSSWYSRNQGSIYRLIGTLAEWKLLPVDLKSFPRALPINIFTATPLGDATITGARGRQLDAEINAEYAWFIWSTQDDPHWFERYYLSFR